VSVKTDRAAAIDEVMSLLTAMEELQSRKVIELARRLRPGLTAEDIRNPHDFPELDDTDWHFADGQLAGIQSVITALRARRQSEEEGCKSAPRPHCASGRTTTRAACIRYPRGSNAFHRLSDRTRRPPRLHERRWKRRPSKCALTRPPYRVRGWGSSDGSAISRAASCRCSIPSISTG